MPTLAILASQPRHVITPAPPHEWVTGTSLRYVGGTSWAVVTAEAITAAPPGRIHGRLWAPVISLTPWRTVLHGQERERSTRTMSTSSLPALPVRYKQPAEIRTLTFDFSAKLAHNATLTGTPTTVGESGITVGAGTISSNGKLVSMKVSGGSLGTTYKVTCRCGATNGDTLELDCHVTIAEVN